MDQAEGFYFKGISRRTALRKCIEAKGDYIEEKRAQLLLMVIPKVQGQRTFLSSLALLSFIASDMVIFSAEKY